MKGAPPPGYTETAQALTLALQGCLEIAAALGCGPPRFRALPVEVMLCMSLHKIGMNLAVDETARIVMGALLVAARRNNVTYDMFRAALTANGIEPEICGLSDLGLTPVGHQRGAPS